MDISKQYDRIGSDFVKGQKEFFSKKTDYAREFIKKCTPHLKGKKVLDLGCGHGHDIVAYEKLGAAEVYGIDSSSFMVNKARKIVKSPEKLFVSSMEKMPFEDNFFDVIIGRFSIHYVENLSGTYEEISRIMKKSGELVIVTHHPLLGFMQTGAKNYNNKDLIKMPLYKNKVQITFPHHTLKEYFPDSFFKHFMISYLDEEPLDDPEYPNKWNVPGFIAFKAIKK